MNLMPRTTELFTDSRLTETADADTGQEPLGPGSVILRRFAAATDTVLVNAINDIASQAPFRHMQTPGGFTMSAAMTNCGPAGWISDTTGYRYTTEDPLSGKLWPPLPASFIQLANSAATAAGFQNYQPDVCLINRYEPGAKMSLHQDKNERDFSQPIVSVSLGLPMTFLFGGMKRKDKPDRIQLQHGDVVVWGGKDRLRYHGVLALKDGDHPLLGRCRINMTFRKAR